MSKEHIKKAAHYFNIDEETIEKFIHDFFNSPDVNVAMKVRDNFIESHKNNTTTEKIDDFLLFMSDKGGI